MKVHFYLDRHRGKQENLPVFLHFWNRGELLRVFTGEHCDEKNWNSKTERVKNNIRNAREINRILDAQENEIVRFVRQEKTSGNICTKVELKQNISFINGKKPGFFQVWDAFVFEHEMKQTWSKATYLNFKVLKNHLLAFDKKVAIKFETIDKKVLQSFVTYQTINGLSLTYINKNINQLKWFLNWASIKGHNRNLSYKQFRFRKKEKIIIARPDIYLTPPELIRILKLKIQDQRVELVRDAFCFACFTGLNYAELARLRKKDISGTQLCYNPHKTNRIVVVELADTSKIIAEKYKSTPGIFLFVLPGIQVFNRVLKEIGNQAGIDEMHCLDVLKEDTRYPKWQLLSSSASKRTFINMCVGLGIGMDVMTGLTGYAASTLNKYYPLAKDKINNEIRKLNSAIITNI